MSRILLVGPGRSGTTWVGNVLGMARGARGVSEPDGPHSDVLGAMLKGRLGEYPVLRPEQESFWYRLTWDLAFSGGWPWDQSLAARSAGRRLVRVPRRARDAAIVGLAVAVSRTRTCPEHVIVKSINSIFSLDWIAQRYRPSVVVLRRDPINVASSWWALGWPPLAWDSSLALREKTSALGLPPPPIGAGRLAEIAWSVGTLDAVITETLHRHPDWIAVSYEDLSASPLEAFPSIYKRLGLEWDARVGAYLEVSDRPGYTVHDGNARKHPNALSDTDRTTSRREQSATQWRRRFDEKQADLVRSILDEFRLHHAPSP